MTALDNPLLARPTQEVTLKDAPLVRVLTQLRFPKILSIPKEEFVAPFQEAIREEYPVLRLEEGQEVLFGSGGVEARAIKVWRFHDLQENWRVSLGTDFLALETTAYTSRSDFVGRFARVAQALKDHIDPKTVDRLGVRYIDRIHGDALSNIDAFVRPEMAGILSTNLGDFAQQSISETFLRVPDAPWAMSVRWGKLPAGATLDPNVLEPIEADSWILDLDVFQQESRSLEVAELTSQAEHFAERVYTFFRWVVTDNFLVHYGGKP